MAFAVCSPIGQRSEMESDSSFPEGTRMRGLGLPFDSDFVVKVKSCHFFWSLSNKGLTFKMTSTSGCWVFFFFLSLCHCPNFNLAAAIIPF